MGSVQKFLLLKVQYHQGQDCRDYRATAHTDARIKPMSRSIVVMEWLAHCVNAVLKLFHNFRFRHRIIGYRADVLKKNVAGCTEGHFVRGIKHKLFYEGTISVGEQWNRCTEA